MVAVPYGDETPEAVAGLPTTQWVGELPSPLPSVVGPLSVSVASSEAVSAPSGAHPASKVQVLDDANQQVYVTGRATMSSSPAVLRWGSRDLPRTMVGRRTTLRTSPSSHRNWSLLTRQPGQAMADRGDILTVNNDGLGWGEVVAVGGGRGVAVGGGRGAATHAGFATANASLHAVDTPLYAANVGLHTRWRDPPRR